VILARVAELEQDKEKEEEHRKEEKERHERLEELALLDREMRGEFPDLLPLEFSPVVETTSTTRHHLKLIDPTLVHNQRGYVPPRRYLESWCHLLDQHIAAGRLRPSSSPFSSPAFIISKKDPTELPRWVNDYRKLNANTVKDRTLLPLPDEVLQSCTGAEIWGKIDMTNLFFQTRMNEEDIEKTTVKTPWGLFEWVVMPMGLCNAPATHQRHVNEALGDLDLIGQICYAYLDNIVIWLDSDEQHRQHCCQVLACLRKAGLYCSVKKTDLATERVEFLGHVISAAGIEANPAKIAKIAKWPLPKMIKQLHGYLGLVQYLRKFIPGLVEHTARLTLLTKKNAAQDLTGCWTKQALQAFEVIKQIVVKLVALQAIDHSARADPIWVMTNSSCVGLGSVLIQGPKWETAHPVAYHSRQFIPAEVNYPTHEQELLTIVDMLAVWRNKLMGLPFIVLSDHHTLGSFLTQKNLSRRQARWTEALADYDFTVVFIPGRRTRLPLR
jgi:hypothetical protein